jgi:hypothetical protein
MSKNQAGKGDKPRPVNKEHFDQNFDQIKWNSKQEENRGTTKKNKTTYKY